jgi:hypothetical protein
MTQAMGMAPGSTMLYMYVCGDAYGTGSISDTACLSAMVTDTDAPLSLQISSSWSWEPADPSIDDPYFEQMATQDQNFFVAAGDNQAWCSNPNEGCYYAWPAEDGNVVTVGGTDLTTSGAAGPWASETAWFYSGGGISPDGIAIPSWQQLSGVINLSNMGSTTLRNGPDVSANANFTFYTCDDQGHDQDYGGAECGANIFGGTSFAAPMWAGYLALANQQAVANGETIGFINPTIYSDALTSSYSTLFHDVTSGNCGTYSAVTGYDLCTGWGSPNGAGLISALAASFTLTNLTTPAAVLSGESTTFTVTVTAVGSSTFAANVTFTCSGLPANTTCSAPPITATTPSPVQETVTIQTTGPNQTQGEIRRRRADNRSPWLPLTLPLAGIVMAGVAGRKVWKHSAVASLCVSLMLLGLLVACGGGPAAPIIVGVSSGTALYPNDAADGWPNQTESFTATVTGTSNTAVTWSLSSSTSSCPTPYTTLSQCGQLSSTTANPVTYTAPTIASGLPSGIIITATSAADTTKNGQSAFNLNPATVPGTYPTVQVTATEAGAQTTSSDVTLTVN